MTGSFEKTSPELTPEIVEDTLSKLKEAGVLLRLRSLINGSNTFFDPKNGYLVENDESSTNAVLDLYLEMIKTGGDLAVKDLREIELKESIIQALEPNSSCRMVLFAYWGIDEATPWYQTEQNITSYQTYNNKDFPNGSDLTRVVNNLSQKNE